MKFCKSQRELAKELGIAFPNLSKHARNGGPGKTSKGYCVEVWRRYLSTKDIHAKTTDALLKTGEGKKQEPKAGDDLGGLDAVELKRLKVLEEVRKIQIDNLTKAGKLVRVNWHEEQMAAMAGELQAELKTMVRTLPPEIAGLSTVEAQKVLERAVNGIIGKMSRGKDQS